MSVDAETIAFANRLADAAGAAIRPHFRQRLAVADKHQTLQGRAFFDPVTEADRNAEAAIRALIEREHPADGILGEELGEKKGSSGRRWVLDPVDGTRAFISGRHEWGSLIALEEAGRPVLGILDQPVLGERFIGVNGAARLQQAGDVIRLRTRDCPMEEAILCSTDPSAYFNAEEQAAFARVSRAARMTRYGGDCYLFAAMALGFVDLIIETNFHPWDIAALIPLVEGAGGVISNWTGGPCNDGKQILAAGSAALHAEAMRLLKG
jgi:myo-inositol-1(or 4)-monophosphatase